MSDHYQSSGNSSHIGYVPEVRTSYHEPIFVGGQIVDSEWRQIKIERDHGLVGIPDGYFDAKLRENDLWGFYTSPSYSLVVYGTSGWRTRYGINVS